MKVHLINNQCDGCMNNMPIVDFLHRTRKGEPYMGCTKARYDKMNALTIDQLYILKNIDYDKIACEHQTDLLWLQSKGFTVMTIDRNGSCYWDLTALGSEVVRLYNIKLAEMKSILDNRKI